MDAAQLDRLRDHLTRLLLLKSRERLDALLQEAAAKGRMPTSSTRCSVKKSTPGREEYHDADVSDPVSICEEFGRLRLHLPTSLDKKQLQQVATCHFIEHGENVVLLGPPGVGKSHLAIGLGLHAIERGYRVLFTTAAAMIATLTRALTENRLEDKLKLYTIPRLLIIDEIGYLPIDRTRRTCSSSSSRAAMRRGR